MTDTSAFRTVLRGYEPSQVDHAVAELATSVEAARQEAAARTVEVANLHAANTALERSVATHASRIAELEAAVLDRSRPRRTFRRIGVATLAQLLSETSTVTDLPQDEG